jgi:hypothetical protein
MLFALAIWVRVRYISRWSLPGVCIVITVIAEYKKRGRLAPRWFKLCPYREILVCVNLESHSKDSTLYESEYLVFDPL